MATASVANERAVSPFDVSNYALYTDDTWREPFARLRAEMPVSWCPESPYGAYWSVVTLAPFNYAQIVFASLVSFLFFDHVPDDLTLIGMLIIILSGAGLVLWQRR